MAALIAMSDRTRQPVVRSLTGTVWYRAPTKSCHYCRSFRTSEETQLARAVSPPAPPKYVCHHLGAQSAWTLPEVPEGAITLEST